MPPIGIISRLRHFNLYHFALYVILTGLLHIVWYIYLEQSCKNGLLVSKETVTVVLRWWESETKINWVLSHELIKVE